jgi:hypothetical protein
MFRRVGKQLVERMNLREASFYTSGMVAMPARGGRTHSMDSRLQFNKLDSVLT